MGPIQLIPLAALLIANETIAELTVLLADDDRGWSTQESENNAYLVMDVRVRVQSSEIGIAMVWRFRMKDVWVCLWGLKGNFFLGGYFARIDEC